MEENKSANRIHPLVASAAACVMLVSLTGVAAITGLIPNSHSTGAPTTMTPANAPAVATAATSPVNLMDPKASSNYLGEPQRTAAMTESEPTPAARPAQKPAARANQGYHAPVTQNRAICESCGRVESIQVHQEAAQPSGLGVVAGAVLGGVLGNQVGGGNGRKLATVAGAVGGGYAGNEVEKRTRSTTSYQVRVRMEDGRLRSFPYSEQPGWNVGDRVRVMDGQLTTRG